MYTIKEASARTGVGAPLIRAWERRYGVVRPTRTASGYRLYDDAALKVLLIMRWLVDNGWTASEAARAIGAGEVSVDEAALPVRVPRSAPGAGVPAGDREGLIARFLAASEAASPAGTEAVLDEILASGSFEAIVDDLLMRAAAAIGDAWAKGRLSVAAEHAASAALTRRLAAVYQAAGIPRPPAVVVGLPPGSRHELGALAFAAALRRRGVGVLYIGPDVPVDAWVDAVGAVGAQVAVLGIVTSADREPAGEVIAALRAHGVPVIAVGGRGSGDQAALDGAVYLPERIVDAAAAVAELVGRQR